MIILTGGVLFALYLFWLGARDKNNAVLWRVIGAAIVAEDVVLFAALVGGMRW